MNVFSIGGVDDMFGVFKTFPLEEVPCSSSTTLEECELDNSTLVVETMDSGCVLDLLESREV